MAELTRSPIDSARVLASVSAPSAGAVLSFAGVVRDHHGGRTVTGIEYHAYESMALRQLETIEQAASEHWPSVRIAIVHRVGMLAVGDASVLIAVGSPHRAEGFAALRYAIEEIKRRVPIWKKELYPDGYAWIEGS